MGGLGSGGERRLRYGEVGLSVVPRIIVCKENKLFSEGRRIVLDWRFLGSDGNFCAVQILGNNTRLKSHPEG